MNNFFQKAFSLIELLVVVSIIGVLISFSYVGFSQARKSARDGKRKADLEQIRSALEIYRNDLKTYPTTAQGLNALKPGYLQEIPADPVSTNRYSYTGSINTYVLCAHLEMGGSAVAGCGDCGEACNYKVINP